MMTASALNMCCCLLNIIEENTVIKMQLNRKQQKIPLSKWYRKQMKRTQKFRHTSVNTATHIVLFTLHSDNYCQPLPHKTQSLYCTFGEHRDVNSCVACILLTTVHGSTLPTVRLHIKRHCTRLRVFLKQRFPDRLFCLVQPWGVFVLVSRAAHNNQHFGIFRL